MVDTLFPKNTFRRRVVRKLANRLLGRQSFDAYSNWAFENNDNIGLFKAPALKTNPLISVVVPAFNTPPKYLYPFVYSVVGQVYENWELVIVNASTNKADADRVDDVANIDTRIRVVTAENKGIATNTNVGVAHANGEYIGFMDHDDVLTLDALYEVAKAINDNKDAGLIYSDEDKLTEDGLKFINPHFKPDWSPDLLTHVNYITHFTVIRKRLIDKVGGLDSDRDGAQDYDLTLKVTDLKPVIVHIPKILYHWREADNSTAQSIESKPYVKSAGERSLAEHYKRKGIAARPIALPAKPGFYKIEYRDAPKPTVIIPLFAEITLVRHYIKLLLSQGYLKDVQVLTCVDLPKKDAQNIKFLPSDSFLKRALEQANDNVVFLNDFVIPQSHSWLEDLSGPLMEEHVHSVSPIIVRTDNTIDDCGLVRNGFETSGLFKGRKYGTNTFFGDTDWTRNVDATTGKVVALRKKDFTASTSLPQDIRTLLHEYSTHKPSGRYNVASAAAVMQHVRSSQQYGNSEFMNANLQNVGSEMHLYPTDQQTLDALLALTKGEN